LQWNKKEISSKKGKKKGRIQLGCYLDDEQRLSPRLWRSRRSRRDNHDRRLLVSYDRSNRSFTTWLQARPNEHGRQLLTHVTRQRFIGCIDLDIHLHNMKGTIRNHLQGSWFSNCYTKKVHFCRVFFFFKGKCSFSSKVWFF